MLQYIYICLTEGCHLNLNSTDYSFQVSCKLYLGQTLKQVWRNTAHTAFIDDALWKLNGEITRPPPVEVLQMYRLLFTDDRDVFISVCKGQWTVKKNVKVVEDKYNKNYDNFIKT
jgi:hypothetical protein